MPIITEEWDKVLGNQLNQPYLNDIQMRLKSDIQDRFIICPKIENIFRAYKLTPYSSVKVLILGQDPYYKAGRADGLAFSSEYMTPSMDIIIKEIKHSTGKVRTRTELDDWALQGVFLLNTILTTVQGKPAAHEDIGWEKFTRYTIQRLLDRTQPMVVMLWGSYAIKFGSMINASKHFVLKAPHPASDAYGTNSNTFLGCKHFEMANDWLQSKNLKQINWGD